MAAKKKTAKTKTTEAAAPAVLPRVVGKVELRDLGDVKPNPWNPNVMNAFETESLKNGLLADGWLISQALLIWGKDDKGKTKNLIIDGEHRWTGAGELGLAKGPMVFLDGLTESQAKALTIKMNAKRGKFQEDRLADVIRSIQYDLDVPDFALDLGIAQAEIMKMLAVQPESLGAAGGVVPPPVVAPPPAGNPAMQHGHVVLVQLFFSKEDHAEFLALARAYAEETKAKNVSDTVLAAMRNTKDAEEE